MNEQETSFTVFADYPGGYHGNFNDSHSTPGWGGLSLPALIEKVVAYRPGITPVAWAPEGTRGYGGTKTFEQLRAESIRAGRLIEKTPCGWVALGAEKQEEEQAFRDALARDAADDMHIQSELRKVEPTSAPDKQHVERRLPPLDWNRPTPFDPFKCFVIVRGGYRDEQDVMLAPRHALQLSIDSCAGPSDHLNASRHQMAAIKG